ncbi:MAG: hypothetical protein ACK5PZ_01195, partial [Pirellula sp.]
MKIPTLASLAAKIVAISLLVSMFPLTVVNAIAKDSTDVTAKVAAAVKGNKVVIPANNDTFGDTAPGIPKKLTVEYQLGEEKLEKETNEGGQIEIVAPAGKELKIIKAFYGPVDGSKPVNIENPAEVLDTLPGFTIEHVLSADGAINGSWICMTKDPKGRLLLGGQSG